jgi:T4 RnlA family RNA ligase
MYTLEYLSGFVSKEIALEAITEELGIKVKEYDSGLIVLSYNQINSPKTHPVVMECRGLILEYVDSEFKVVCRPFKRFFNHGEAPDTLTDFSFDRSEVMEKPDGSLIKCFHHDGKWEIATRGTAYAESENYTGAKFRSMVLESLSMDETEFQYECSHSGLDVNATHLYEFTSPDNRIVTPYEKAELVYLGSVCSETGSIFDGNTLSVRDAESYPLSSLEDCVKAAAELDGLKEGFVVRDLKSGQMVKIKSPLYVAAHHLRGDHGLTPKKIIKLVVTNETAEYLSYFAEDEVKVKPYQLQWDIIKASITIEYEANKLIDDKKEFALKVKDLPYSAVLFQSKAKNISPENVLLSQGESYKIKLLTNCMEDL